MVIVAAIIVAVAGSMGVLAATLIGFLLAKWLGRGLASGTAILLVIALLADLNFIRVMLRDANNADSTVIAQILGIGYAAPIVVALPCIFFLARLSLKA